MYSGKSADSKRLLFNTMKDFRENLKKSEQKIETEPSIVQEKEIKIAANSNDNHRSRSFSSMIDDSGKEDPYVNPARFSEAINSKTQLHLNSIQNP